MHGLPTPRDRRTGSEDGDSPSLIPVHVQPLEIVNELFRLIKCTNSVGYEIGVSMIADLHATRVIDCADLRDLITDEGETSFKVIEHR